MNNCSALYKEEERRCYFHEEHAEHEEECAQKGRTAEYVDMDGTTYVRQEQQKTLTGTNLDVTGKTEGSDSKVSVQTNIICKDTNRYEGPSVLLSKENVRNESDEDLDVSHCMSLQQASQEGSLCRVHFILSQNPACIHCRGGAGRTPTMVAARYGHVAVFDFLLSLCCNITLLGGNLERTSVVLAARHVKHDMGRLLDKSGCNMTAVDEEGNNILHLACWGGHVEMVSYILNQGIHDIDSRNMLGRTPVVMAAWNGKHDVLRLLDKNGCNMTAVDKKGNNILHLACLRGYVDMVSYILNQSIPDINSRGDRGRTPVMLAARNGKTDLVRLLDKKGCNMTAVDEDGNNILHLACWGGNAELVSYILNHGIPDIDSRGDLGRTPVMLAARSGKTDLVRLLDKSGCNMTAVDEEGNNILHLACWFGNVEMVSYILNQGIPDIESRGDVGRTPVMLAARSGKMDLVRLLDKKRCSMTAVDEEGNNILHLACLSGHVDMVSYLLACTIINLKDKNKSGMTPVQMAKSKKLEAVVALFHTSI